MPEEQKIENEFREIVSRKWTKNHSKIFPTIWWNYCWNFNFKKVIIIIWFFVFLLLWKRERRKKLHNFSIIYFPQQLTSFFLISRKQRKNEKISVVTEVEKKENVFHCDLRQKKINWKKNLHEIDGEIKMFYKNLYNLLIFNRKAFFVQNWTYFWYKIVIEARWQSNFEVNWRFNESWTWERIAKKMF